MLIESADPLKDDTNWSGKYSVTHKNNIHMYILWFSTILYTVLLLKNSSRTESSYGKLHEQKRHYPFPKQLIYHIWKNVWDVILAS